MADVATGVGQALRGMGLHMKGGWIREILRSGQSSASLGVSPEDRAYQMALHSDFREAAAGCLPPEVASFDNHLVQGKFVLQVRLLAFAVYFEPMLGQVTSLKAAGRRNR